MNIRKISLSAHKLDLEPWRLDRLNDVVNYIEAEESVPLLLKMCGLHDRKGDLTVMWKLKPTKCEKILMQTIWGNPEVGDGNGRVHNVYIPPLSVQKSRLYALSNL